MMASLMSHSDVDDICPDSACDPVDIGQDPHHQSQLPEPFYHPLPRKDPLRVLQGGFHPDLVFMAPGLSESQRREAIRRVCGAVAVGSWVLAPPVARTR